MNDLAKYYHSLAKTKAVMQRLDMEAEKASIEHWTAIQAVLGCATCQFAEKNALGNGACCTCDEHPGNNELILNGETAPLCKLRVEGEPTHVKETFPSIRMDEFLKAMATKGKVH